MMDLVELILIEVVSSEEKTEGFLRSKEILKTFDKCSLSELKHK